MELVLLWANRFGRQVWGAGQREGDPFIQAQERERCLLAVLKITQFLSPLVHVQTD